jgi:hypothetical protein
MILIYWHTDVCMCVLVRVMFRYIGKCVFISVYPSLRVSTLWLSTHMRFSFSRTFSICTYSAHHSWYFVGRICWSLRCRVIRHARIRSGVNSFVCVHIAYTDCHLHFWIIYCTGKQGTTRLAWTSLRNTGWNGMTTNSVSTWRKQSVTLLQWRKQTFATEYLLR